MKGLLDRFEDNNKAVILIEEKSDEWVVPIDTLPNGSDVNTYFTIEKRDGDYHIIAIDEETTAENRQKTSDLMAKLRAKSKGGKFKKE